MLPSELKPEQFSGYPPEARKLVEAHIGVLRRLPLSFLPSLLREAIEFDYKFPAERRAVEKELANLDSLPADQLNEWMQSFEQIRLSSQLERSDWINAPAQFVEQFSSYLWTTHQLDSFRSAALAYAERLRAVIPPEKPPMPRLGITIVGQGVSNNSEPLFRKLRPHGAYFRAVRPENGVQLLLMAAGARAKTSPVPYGHWYIDGGRAAPCDSALTCVSYHALESVRAVLAGKIRSEIQRPGMGPENLRTVLAQLRPSDLGLPKNGDAVLDRFQVKMLTEGSGTQIFSTTFAQWTAREALRRAQPLTLVVRFGPRQRQKTMNEMLTSSHEVAELDPMGSLVDADMGAYYNWLNLQRLTGAEQATFVVWFEGHNEAVAIGPSMPRGTESTASIGLDQLLNWAS